MYQAIILGFVLLVTLNFLKRSRGPKLNLPPLVPHKIPIIGHTIKYMTDSETFLKQCREKYGDVFSLYIWGRVITFAGKEHTHEVLTKDEMFDFSEAFNRKFPSDLIFKYIDKTTLVKEIKEHVLSKLEFYTERMQKNLYFATQNYIGDCDEPRTIYNMGSFMTEIVSTPIASLFLGEEIAKHHDVITTFSRLTLDVGKYLVVPPILDFIYPRFQEYINRIPIKLGLFNPTTKHRRVLGKRIRNEIRRRLQEKQKYGDSWQRPNDLLQDYMNHESFDATDDISYEKIIDKIFFYIFVSVHTTSRGCANALMDLASRPEYMQELYEEQLEVHKEANEYGTLPFKSLDKMKKLDSFLRESFRLSGNIAALQHIVLKDYTFTNGLQVPKGHAVEIYFDDTTRDELSQGPNPKSFEPFRHLNKNVSASKISKSFLMFGNGKHACPGRHFATNEIKFFLHYAILKYNFRTESGKVEEKRRFGATSLTSNAGIIFEKRI